MSDCLSNVQIIKFTQEVSTSSSLDYIRSRSREPVAFSLNLTNVFVKELSSLKAKYPELTYVQLLNSALRFYKIKDYSERVNKRLATVCSRVTKEYRDLKGGRRFLQLNEKSRSLTIFESELVDVGKLQNDLHSVTEVSDELKARCSTLYDELLSVKKEFHELESSHAKLKLSHADKAKQVEKLEKEIASLREENVFLHDHIRKLQGCPVPTCQGKKIPELKRQQQVRKLKELKSGAERALWFAETFGLIPETLTLKSAASGESHVLEFHNNNAHTSFDNLPYEEKTKIEKLLYILDTFYVSDAAYHEIALTCESGLPSKHLIVQCRNSLSTLFTIHRCSGGVPGAYVDFEEQIANLIGMSRSETTDQKLTVKISGDGAKITRASNFLTMSVSLLKQEGIPCSPTVLAIVSSSESYEILDKALGPLIKQVNSVIDKGKVEIDGREVAIKVLFGADMKFLQIAFGLNGSTANQSCVWCKVRKDDLWDTSKAWNHYSSTDEVKRTYRNICEDALLGRNGVTKGIPLFKIDSDNVVVDELHLMLRISDVLLRNLIFECKDKDAELHFNSTAKDKALIGPNLKCLCCSIRACGVTFNIWEAKDPVTHGGTGKLEWTSLQGPDMKKLLIHLPQKLRSCDILFADTKDDVIKLWEDFRSLHGYLCEIPQDVIDVHLTCFQKAKSWLDSFISLGNKRKGYKKLNVTPYMHVLVYHTPNVIRTHGALKNYSAQSVEKLNDIVKRVTLGKCNRADATRDALLVLKRVENLKDKDLSRKKRSYNKVSEKYWGSEKKERALSKKLRIAEEIENTNVPEEEFPSTVDGIKGELYTKYRYKTTARNYEKLKNILKMKRKLST